MAISSPQSTQAALELDPMRYVVLLGPPTGEAPTRENAVRYLQLQSYSRSAGAARLDAGKLLYRLDLTGQRLMDIAAPMTFHRQIEIRRLDEDDDPSIVETWGFIGQLDQSIDKDQEGLTLDFRLDPYVFGKPLKATPIWDVDADAARKVHWAWIFNPLIDGVIKGNRSSHREAAAGDEDPEDPTGPYAFVSPESIRTNAARLTAQRDEVGSDWKLSTAVHRLCWTCNPDEQDITNPTLDELQDAFRDHDDEVKDHPCPFGKYLPELLDELLRKHGYAWYLTHELEEEEQGEGDEAETVETRVTKLAFYRRGEGIPAQLLMQRPLRSGERFDFRKANVDRLTHSVNLVALANKITGRTGPKEWESTFRLMPGWASEFEKMDDPAADPEDANPAQVPRTLDTLSLEHVFGKDHPQVGRQYVLNEAGDFCEPTRTGETEPYRFTEDLPGDWAIVRRRFHPCLSRYDDADDKQSYRYLVEWWDRNQEDATDPDVKTDPGWIKVKGSYQVLEHQCGIYFEEANGVLWELVQEDALEEPPEGVEHPGLHLRITATVHADEGVEKSAARRGSSPQGETIELFLDLSDKFHYRQVDSASVFSGKSGADTVDDSTRLQDYVTQVRDLEDAGDVSCSITLSGTDHAEWEIGKLCDRIDGRNITLTANNPDAETPRALQIVGLNYQLAGGRLTELLLETFRKEQPVL